MTEGNEGDTSGLPPEPSAATPAPLNRALTPGEKASGKFVDRNEVDKRRKAVNGIEDLYNAAKALWGGSFPDRVRDVANRIDDFVSGAMLSLPEQDAVDEASELLVQIIPPLSVGETFLEKLCDEIHDLTRYGAKGNTPDAKKEYMRRQKDANSGLDGAFNADAPGVRLERTASAMKQAAWLRVNARKANVYDKLAELQTELRQISREVDDTEYPFLEERLGRLTQAVQRTIDRKADDAEGECVLAAAERGIAELRELHQELIVCRPIRERISELHEEFRSLSVQAPTRKIGIKHDNLKSLFSDAAQKTNIKELGGAERNIKRRLEELKQLITETTADQAEEETMSTVWKTTTLNTLKVIKKTTVLSEEQEKLVRQIESLVDAHESSGSEDRKQIKGEVAQLLQAIEDLGLQKRGTSGFVGRTWSWLKRSKVSIGVAILVVAVGVIYLGGGGYATWTYQDSILRAMPGGSEESSPALEEHVEVPDPEPQPAPEPTSSPPEEFDSIPLIDQLPPPPVADLDTEADTEQDNDFDSDTVPSEPVQKVQEDEWYAERELSLPSQCTGDISTRNNWACPWTSPTEGYAITFEGDSTCSLEIRVERANDKRIVVGNCVSSDSEGVTNVMSCPEGKTCLAFEKAGRFHAVPVACIARAMDDPNNIQEGSFNPWDLNDLWVDGAEMPLCPPISATVIPPLE